MAYFSSHMLGGQGVPAPAPRLRLNQEVRGGAVLDGGWWPRSADPMAELAALVLELDRHRGRVRRLELGVTGWRRRPGALEAGGREVDLVWSLSSPDDLLVAVGRDGERTKLLVVPPGVNTFVADSALELAARTSNTASATAVLEAASELLPPPRSAPEAEWESEGGAMAAAGADRTPERGPRGIRHHFEHGAAAEWPPPSRAVVELAGDIDLHTAPALHRSLLDSLLPGLTRVVVDLSGVTFFSAAGVALLVSAHRRAGAVGVDLRLAAPSDQARRVLSLTGVDGLMPVHGSVEEAFGEEVPRLVT